MVFGKVKVSKNSNWNDIIFFKEGLNKGSFNESVFTLGAYECFFLKKGANDPTKSVFLLKILALLNMFLLRTTR